MHVYFMTQGVVQKLDFTWAESNANEQEHETTFSHLHNICTRWNPTFELGLIHQNNWTKYVRYLFFCCGNYIACFFNALLEFGIIVWVCLLKD